MIICIRFVQDKIKYLCQHILLNHKAAAILKCRYIRQNVSHEVKHRIRLEEVEHAKQVLNYGAFSLTFADDVPLPRLHNGQVCKEHERTLDWA